MPSCIKSNGVSIINSVLQSRQSRQHGVSSICGDIAEVKVVTLPVEARHFLHPLSTKEVDEDIFSRAMFKEKVQSGGHLGALQSAWEPESLLPGFQMLGPQAHTEHVHLGLEN